MNFCFQRILEEYDLVIEKTRKQLIEQHEEDIRRLDAQRDEFHNMLKRNFKISDLSLCQNDMRLSEIDSQFDGNISADNASSSIENFDDNLSSESDITNNNGLEDMNDSQIVEHQTNFNNSVLQIQTNSKNISQQPPLPPVKFTILRDTDSSTYQLKKTSQTDSRVSESLSPRSSADSTNTSQKSKQSNNETCEESLSKKRKKIILKTERINESSDSEDENLIQSFTESINLELPEPDEEQEHADIDFSAFCEMNQTIPDEVNEPRIKRELDEDSTTSSVCIFCNQIFAKCGIRRHTERCWKEHGGQSKRKDCCTYMNCNYSIMKSRYSHLYIRNHLRTKHGINNGEASKYIKRKSFL